MSQEFSTTTNDQWYRTPIIAGLILGIVLATTAWLINKRFAESELIQRTREVQLSVRTVLSSLQDAETGVRGFALTSDDRFLEPFRLGKETSLKELAILDTRTADNPDQSAVLAELRKRIDKLILNLGRKVSEVRAGQLDKSLIYQGKGLMDEIRGHIRAMDGIEAKLLDDRLAARADTTRKLTLALALAAIASIAGIVVWILRSRKDYIALAATNDKLAATLTENASAGEQIRQMQKMEAVGQLTGGIAHDFNNMLAITIGSLDMAKKRLSKGNTDVVKLIEGAYDGAQRAATLTKRLLAFSRQQTLNPKVVKPNATVLGMHELLSRAVGETILTETALAAGVWPIEIDQGALENALLNLCVNARDAMPEGGNITIETANFAIDDAYARQHYEVEAGQYVMIAVTDTGTGMTPETITKAFDPFFTTKGVGKGTGLGLSQVHGFVKQSKGHIKIYSEPGQGTTVKMYFPRVYGAAVVASQSATSLARGAASDLILVVEDDARVRDVTVSMLRDLGYSVIHASNGEQALVELKSNPAITLLLTDVVMPGMNGRQLADQARRYNPALRVLFTTGYSRNAIVHNGVLEAGVYLLPKPFSMEALSHKLREVLDSQA